MGPSSVFTVFFDGSMWVGVLAVEGARGVHAARQVFGAEPTGPDLLAFARGQGYDRLVARAYAGPTVDAPGRPDRRVNPKRAARLAAREQTAAPVTSAAAAALKAALERSKQAQRVRSRADRTAAEDHRRALARAKAKARHRGR